MDWINVNEELPKEKGRYLVCTINVTGWSPLEEDVFIANYLYGKWIFKGWESNSVTHWMELPKNPNK
jgi:hypothetical protein